MSDVDIKKASRKELIWFSKNVMGLEVVDATSAENLRANIMKAGWTKSFIEREDPNAIEGAQVVIEEKAKPTDVEPEPEVDAAPKESATAVKRRAEVTGKDDKKLKIFVPKQAGSDGDRPIPVGVNGTIILIPREEECEIALRYVQVLQNAVTTEYDFDEVGNSTPRDVKLYPFQVIEGREHLS